LLKSWKEIKLILNKTIPNIKQIELQVFDTSLMESLIAMAKQQ